MVYQYFSQDLKPSLSSDDFKNLLQDFIEQMQGVPLMDEIRQRMEKDHQAVDTLICWLDTHVK